MRLFSWAWDALLLRRGAVIDPRFLTYTVTFACNARCVMCDSWKKTNEGELALGEIEHIFRQLPALDAVRLTGGEPFVRPDLGAIAELAGRHLKPRFLHVTTNGFLTDRIIRFCEERRRIVPLKLLVSLDGSEDKHNEVRGRPTAWKTATETLRRLAPRQAEFNMQVSVNQVILGADGLEEYRRLREFLRPFRVRHQAVVAYHASATYSVRAREVVEQKPGIYESFGEVPDVEALTREMEADLADAPLPERVARRYYLEGLRRRMLQREGIPNPPCVALRAHLRLFPNGDVPVCQFNSYSVGNLRTSSFRDIWYGRTIEAHRQWVRRCPGCWAECEVVPNAVYTADLLRHTIFGSGKAPSPRLAPPARVASGPA